MSEERPSPQTIFDTLIAYQKSAALKGAIDLDLFSAVAAGATGVAALAAHTGASERGVRSLCDYLVVAGFLEKRGPQYGLTKESATYLVRDSADYIGSISEFLNSVYLQRAFDDVAGAVRKGGTLLEERGLMGTEHKAWEEFARAMAPMAATQAEDLAELLDAQGIAPGRVLDVAAGHGLYGIALARRWPETDVVFQDWPKVVELAEQNAREAGIEGRYRGLSGNALAVEFDGPFDTVLLTNFLHHFDPPTCIGLLRKVHDALAPKGRVVTIESTVNADRISPGQAAAFSLVMLVTTPSGDAYTQREIEGMFRDAGFPHNTIHPLGRSPQQAIISRI